MTKEAEKEVKGVGHKDRSVEIKGAFPVLSPFI
jgi:hypothetical protein